MKLNPPLPVLLCCLLGLPAAGIAQTHTVVPLSEPGALNPVEVSVAINPANPAHILATSLQYGAYGQPRVVNFTYTSRDGGATWQSLPAHNPDGRIQGDDAVAFDANGTAYHSYIAFTGLREDRPERANTGIFVQTSATAGRSWNQPVAVVDHLNTLQPFEDKPYLVADDVAGSRFKDNVYLAWTRFDKYGSAHPADSTQIYFSRSLDGGQHFSVPIQISDRGGDCVDGDQTVEGAVPAIGVEGEVYVVWAGPQGLVVDRSLDGGSTFGIDRVIGDNPGGWDIDIDGINRHNGMPVSGVDHSTGPHRGTLYVNWIDERNGDPDVFVRHSKDGGQTWTAPVRVNDDALRNGRAQLFTWMAVDPVDGSINVVFHDRRSGTGTQTGVTLARSIDGGQTFINYPVALDPFETRPEVFFGDYNGIDAYGGRVVAAFPHFIGPEEVALSAAVFTFKPGTQEAAP